VLFASHEGPKETEEFKGAGPKGLGVGGVSLACDSK